MNAEELTARLRVLRKILGAAPSTPTIPAVGHFTATMSATNVTGVRVAEIGA
jgi:hypothetical protein